MEKDMESAHIEIERDMESAHIEIERDMEERVKYRMLMEAAIQGKNMEELPRLLQDDPAILDRVRWECRGKDNPLHVGALYGNVDFVREILNRKRELTRELNSEGQSPLHLASARGHVEVVREILSQDADACLTHELNSEGQSSLHLASERGRAKVVKEILSKDADACFNRDRDGMIPLHLAAIKGQVEVLEELVKAEKITAFILTKRGEPILHVCANNNKFEALKKLIELFKDDPDFVNLRDRDDNTILHLLAANEKLAAKEKQEKLELIRLLVQKGTVDVNAVNIHGSMPLDVSMGKSQGLPGWNTDFYLINAGAKRSVPIFWIGQNWMTGGWFNEALLVVAILLVTVAFQAGMNPPGGVWQDTGYHNATLPNAPQSSPPKLVHHYAGESVMSHVDRTLYKRFSVLNDVTLLSSILVIVVMLKECFVKSLFNKVLAIVYTFISVCTMWAAYSVSSAYISSVVQTWRILLVIIYASMMVVVIIITPPNFHVVYFEILRAVGIRSSQNSSSVQARAVGRP